MEESLDNLSISEWIANAIVDSGCNVVYGGHGGALVPLVNAVCKNPHLTWVYARNEHDAAEMAAAHAKFTGGIGVVIATSGPGATNLVTGLMEAELDHVALLAITGLKPTAQLGYAEFQDVDQSRLFAGAGIEWSKNAASVNGVIPLLRDAVSVALSRKTCVHLAIPVDIQAAPSPIPYKTFCAPVAYEMGRGIGSHLNHELIKKTAKTLVGGTHKYERNVICVGSRCSYSNEGKNIGTAILELAESLNAPVLTRIDAKGVVDEMHPLSLGVVGVHGKPGLETGTMVVSSADRVINIGVEDSAMLITNLAGLQKLKSIQIEPDIFGISTRFTSECVLVGDLYDICKELAENCELLMYKKHKKEIISSGVSKELVRDKTMFKANMRQYMKTSAYHLASVMSFSENSLDAAAEKADYVWDTYHRKEWQKIVKLHDCLAFKLDRQESESFCHPACVLEEISILRRKTTDDVFQNAVINVDVGDVTLWASLCLTLNSGSRTLYSEHLGTMGYALCAGIASILARPAPAAAIVLAGDAGFQMTLQELATFQQVRRPGDKLICIVFDNEKLGRVAFGFDESLGCDTIGPDYVLLAKAYGADGFRINNSQQVKEGLTQAMLADGLFILHVIVDPELKAEMATFKDNSLVVMNSG